MIDVNVIISMMVICNDIVLIEYDRRISGICNAPLDMKYENNSIEY